ncbi:hypothetical protein SpCBS45565_g06254 [Spizellomyces sp. 'palustris']|nr:hypothetical protein SpCBS45565_g06254 [Spizellomyces sp. 'palustris']
MPLKTEAQLEKAVLDATTIFDGYETTMFDRGFLKMDVIRRTATEALGPAHWISNWVKGFLCVQTASRGTPRRAGQLAMEWLIWSAEHVRPHYPHIHARHLASIGPYCVRAGLARGLYEHYGKIVPWVRAEFMGSEEVVQRLNSLVAGADQEDQNTSGAAVNDWLPAAITTKATVTNKHEVTPATNGRKKNKRRGRK